MIKQITDSIGLFRYPNLQLLTVGNWKVVCNKNSFKVGEKVFYVGINNWINLNTKYASYLTKYLHINNNGLKGYWIKPIHINGIISNGLIFPLNMQDMKNDIKNYDVFILNKVSYPCLHNVLSAKLYNHKYTISKYLDIKSNTKQLREKSTGDILTLHTFKYNNRLYLDNVYSANKQHFYSINEINTLANKLSYNVMPLIDNNIEIDININKLITETTKYADCFFKEDSNCKGLVFRSLDNTYNFLVPSMEYYMTQSNEYPYGSSPDKYPYGFPDDDEITGDWEYVETDNPQPNVDTDVTVMENTDIQTTDGHIDTD